MVRGLGIEAGSRLGNGKSSKKEDGEVSLLESFAYMRIA